MMKKLSLVIAVLLTASTFAQKADAKDAWLEKWNNSKDYLVAIAEAMPEEAYDFKPTERQMTFIEQLVHIKGNIDWLSTTYFTETEFVRGKSELPNTKAAAIALITEAFNKSAIIIEAAPEGSLSETVDFFAGPKSKLQILNLLQDHVTHHRGQLIVYLNLNDVEPPSYLGW